MESDIQWWLTKCQDDYLSTNVAEIAGLTLILRRLGNEHVELITPVGRSILPDGKPSPDAWHMIDEHDPAAWIARII